MVKEIFIAKRNSCKDEKEKNDCIQICEEDLSSANGSIPITQMAHLKTFAGITSENGKVLGIMPHPERALEF